MMIHLGNKIRELRRSRDISQETLANHLGVSFQAVSKWETGATLPDVTLVPAIASFLREQERFVKIQEILKKHSR